MSDSNMPKIAKNRLFDIDPLFCNSPLEGEHFIIVFCNKVCQLEGEFFIIFFLSADI